MCKGRILSLKVYIWVEALTKRQISLDMQKKKPHKNKQTKSKEQKHHKFLGATVLKWGVLRGRKICQCWFIW